MARLIPPGATLVFGADDPRDRRSGRQLTAKGCDRAAGRSSQPHVSRCFGLTWGAMRLLVPVPWSRRVWARPCLPARCWPAEKPGQRRHKTSLDWVRQRRPQVRRWLPGPRRVLVVEGGWAAVSRALVWVKLHVMLGSRRRWKAAWSHPPGPQPPGKRGGTPWKGPRPRGLQGGAERSEAPWEPVEVPWSGGQRTQRWVVSRTALWDTPGLPPVAIRDVLGADPEGKRRMEAFVCPDLQATPAQILAWVVRRWSGEATCAEARPPLGLETPRPWSDQAIARTTPVLLALFSLVTVLALQLSRDAPIPVPVTAW